MAYKIRVGEKWAVYDRVPGKKTPKYFGIFPFAKQADDKITDLDKRKASRKWNLADYTATLWEYIQRYIDLPDADRNKGTRWLITYELSLAKRFFPEANKLVDFTVQDIRNYIAWLWKKQEGKRAFKHSSVHIALRNLSSVFNLARKDGIITVNPVQEPLEKLGQPKGKRIMLSVEQQDRLFDAALKIKLLTPRLPQTSTLPRNVQLYRMIKTLYSTGVRQAELLNMAKEDMISPTQIEVVPTDYDEAGKQPTKSDDPYIVELNSEVAPWFQEVEAGPIFPGWSKMSFYCIFKRCVRMAGLMEKLSPHGMRHTYAKDSLQNGATLVELKAQMNHKDLKTTLRYARYERNKLKQNAEALVRTPAFKVA